METNNQARISYRGRHVNIMTGEIDFALDHHPATVFVAT